MQKTQNDLSCDNVKIDYSALIDVSRYALSSTINTVIRTGCCMRDELMGKEHRGTAICISASGLESTVEQLIIAAETHNALVAGINRSEKQIVNVQEGD